MQRIGEDLTTNVSGAVLETVETLFGEKMYMVDAKDRKAAAVELLNRSGFNAVTQHNVSVEPSRGPTPKKVITKAIGKQGNASGFAMTDNRRLRQDLGGVGGADAVWDAFNRIIAPEGNAVTVRQP